MVGYPLGSQVSCTQDVRSRYVEAVESFYNPIPLAHRHSSKGTVNSLPPCSFYVLWPAWSDEIVCTESALPEVKAATSGSRGGVCFVKHVKSSAQHSGSRNQGVLGISSGGSEADSSMRSGHIRGAAEVDRWYVEVSGS